jgi:hypothetical protein
MAVTNQTYIHEEIKRRLNVENTCYHSVQNVLPSYLISKYTKIKTYKTIISFVAFNGCDT